MWFCNLPCHPLRICGLWLFIICSFRQVIVFIDHLFHNQGRSGFSRGLKNNLSMTAIFVIQICPAKCVFSINANLQQNCVMFWSKHYSIGNILILFRSQVINDNCSNNHPHPLVTQFIGLQRSCISINRSERISTIIYMI